MKIVGIGQNTAYARNIEEGAIELVELHIVIPFVTATPSCLFMNMLCWGRLVENLEFMVCLLKMTIIEPL